MMEKQEIKALAKAIVKEMDSMHSADLAPRWQGASVYIVPKEANAREHEIPVDKLLHKIVMIRNNLRVLEQQVNSSPTLSESEKVKFQSYITKCYGSMTSFNFLFWDDEDKFKSK